MIPGIRSTKKSCAALATLTALLLGGSMVTGSAATAHSPLGGTELAAVTNISSTHGPAAAQPTPLQSTSCPAGWLCLYEHADFKGRMLQFRDDRWQQLSAYGFNDKTSSWHNRLGRNACLSKHWPATNSPKLTLGAGAKSSRMGSWNDEASGVKPGRC